MKTRRPHNQKDSGTETDLEIDKSARVLSVEVPLEAELVWVAALGAIVFLAGLVLDFQLLRLVGKPWPVIALARWMRSRAREEKRLDLSTASNALIAGAFGDVLLEIGEDFFLPGLVAFLVGHLLYVVALHRETTGYRWVRAAPGLLFVVAMVGLLAPRLAPPVLIAIGIYAFVTAIVIFRAADRIDAPGLDPKWARLGLVGAATFAASDAIIGIDRFHTEIPGARYLVMATYWTAQGLLAMSLWRAGRERVAAPAPLPEAYTAERDGAPEAVVDEPASEASAPAGPSATEPVLETSAPAPAESTTDEP